MNKPVKNRNKGAKDFTQDFHNTITTAEGLPRVSILLPMYNAEATLPTCLKSILRQTIRDWECIIVNDGSTDLSLELISTFSQNEPRFRIFNREHHGLVDSLNFGLEQCRGQFIARMDADDIMHSRRLELQLKALRNKPHLDAVSCAVRLFPRSSLKEGLREYEAWLNAVNNAERMRLDAFVECPIAHPSLFIRTDVLQAYRYREMGWAEDYDLILRLIQDGKQLSSVPRRLLAWRNGQDRMSMTHPSFSVAQFTKCKAYFLALDFLAQHDHYILWGYGKTGKAIAQALSKHGKYPTHIIDLHPGRLGNKIMGAEVIPPEALSNITRKPLIVSVARPKPRDEIRRALDQLNFVELEDFVCAA